MEVRRSLARYKPDISLGNILTAVGMSAAVVVWGLRLEGRVDAGEREAVLRQQNTELRFGYVGQQMERQKTEVDGLVVEIKATLRRIEDKLDNKADKAK